MKRRFTSLLGVTLASVILTSPSVLANNRDPVADVQIETYKASKVPTFSDVSVHDPSVIKVYDTYYVFGSHLGVAKTKDLINWELVHSGVTDDNPIIPNIKTELAQAFEWAQSDTLWASDVIQLNDGKYYMYYNACEGSSPRSVTGVAVADSIEGPYKDMGIFLKSGMWGQPSEDGKIYDATKHPNAVDPDVFYDKNEKLWMVYGSYSGGIFILEMDEKTAKPKPLQGYGTKLLGGDHLRIEGAYMQYSPETDYYYLFLSFGGLDSTGGYNLRVARSKTPNGTFEDISGNKMIDAKATPGVFFDDKAIEPYGNKIMGNFNFSNLNEEENFTPYGYVSSGHNSTYYDETTGQYFNIFHTRFPNDGEGHQVRVHQMFMNTEGWFVVAPHRYSGESLQKTKKNDIAGSYHFINHGKEITADITDSVYVELNKDGSITGSVTGTWKLKNNYDAEITINEDRDGVTKKVTYNGVFIEQYDSSQSSTTMSFTAISNEGITIWGSGFDSVKDKDLLENVAATLTVSPNGKVYDDLILQTEAAQNIKIEWTSSNPSVISSTGKVVRPAAGEANCDVELRAKLTKDKKSLTKKFVVTVIAQSDDVLADGMVGYYAFSNNLADSTNISGRASTIGDKIGVTGGSISYGKGTIGEGAYLDGSSAILLPTGLISTNTYTVSMWVNPDELVGFSPAFFGAANEKSWLSLVPESWDSNTMLWSGEAWYDASSSMKIPANKWSHLAFSVDNGSIKLYINGVERFSGTNFPDLFNNSEATFTIGANYWDSPFKGMVDELRVYETALSANHIETLANTIDEDQSANLVATFAFENDLAAVDSTVVTASVTAEKLDLPSDDNLTFGPGIKGSAVIFDGTHGVRLPDGLIKSNTYSVSIWLNPSLLTESSTTFFGAANADSWLSLVPQSWMDQQLTLWSGTAWYDGFTKTTLEPNKWTHVAFTVDNGTATVYVNGVEKFTGSNFPNIFTTDNSVFALGVNYWDTPYVGLMDELNIYNTVLSSQQVKSLSELASH